MTKQKRDRNNFIPTILSKIELASNFHQRVQLAITSRVILNHCKLVFYLRRRHNDLFLYTRLKSDGFGNIVERHNLFLDFYKLIPNLKLDSTKGHYIGWILQLTQDTKDDLIYFLKLISLLSKPKDFYVKDTKIYKSFFNYPEKSEIPVHIQITQSRFLDLRCYDLYKTLTDIGEKNVK